MEMVVLTVEILKSKNEHDNETEYIGEINVPMPMLQTLKIIRDTYDIKDPTNQNEKKGELEMIVFISQKKSLTNYLVEFQSENKDKYFNVNFSFFFFFKRKKKKI